MSSPLHDSRGPVAAKRAGPVIAIDLGGPKVAVARVDARGRLAQRPVGPVDASSSTYVLDQLVRMAGNAAASARPSGIGVAVPGLVRRDGTVWAPNLPGWD